MKRTTPTYLIRREDPPRRSTNTAWAQGIPKVSLYLPDAANFRWRHCAGELRERPGEWWVIREDDHYWAQVSAIKSINGGRARWWRPAGAFEATIRARGIIAATYARYIGGR